MSTVDWALWPDSGVPPCPGREEEGSLCLVALDSAIVL